MLFAARLMALSAALYASAPGMQQFNEYEMKAAYVYNLAKFVDWPPGTFHGPNDPIAICTLGQGPLAKTLAQAMNGERIGERRVAVQQLSDPQKANNCPILVIASSGRKQLQSILSGLDAAGVLTIGESEHFLDAGGVVNLKVEDARVHIEINITAAGHNKLHISPKLLSLARVVK